MNTATHRALTAFFGRAFLISIALQVFALVMVLGLHDWAYQIHSKLFALTPEQFDVATYGFLGAMKTLGLTLFFTPWAALKLMRPQAA